MPFKPGQSGNPKGRPKGSRHKLAETFLSALYKNFETGGPETIERVRAEDPAAYLRVVASVLPKETEVTLRTHLAKELSDDELANIAVGSGEGAVEAPLDPQQLN